MGGITALFIVDDNLKGVRHCDNIVQKHATPSINADQHPLLKVYQQQDNARPHVVTAFLQRNNVHVLHDHLIYW